MDVINKPFFQELEHAEFEKQSLQVTVPRLDQVHPVISGNKWMKLQPWIREAKSKGYKRIVSTGGPWSNHLHAAAYTAMREKLGFTAIIRAKKGMMTPMIADAIQWGAEIEYLENRIDTSGNSMEISSETDESLFIPMGGEGPPAVAAIKDYFNSLQAPGADYIICPVGTGTTLQGIASASIDFHSMIGIDPGIMDTAYTQLFDQLGVRFPGKDFTILGNSTLKKFGKWPSFLPGYMNNWYHQWNLPTDIVYTAKMFFIFMERVQAQYFKNGSSVLLIHTGGLQGNRSLPKGLLDF